MGAAGRKPQPVLPRQGDHLFADHADLGLGLLHVLADPGADLHHRLGHPIGWVPPAESRSPFCRARVIICLRIMPISALACFTFSQTPVPISTTDWCIRSDGCRRPKAAARSAAPG